ncbi:hypothetical protein [Amycolatopsis sp. NPDC058986]
MLVFLVLGLTGATGGTATAAARESVHGPWVEPAGVDGQQIVFVNDLRFVIMACLTGVNQEGKTVTDCRITPDRITRFTGWRWVGTVTVSQYISGLMYFTTQYAHVPRASLTDWWCFSNVFGDLGPC